jgi:hypothetical protein
MAECASRRELGIRAEFASAQAVKRPDIYFQPAFREGRLQCIHDFQSAAHAARGHVGIGALIDANGDVFFGGFHGGRWDADGLGRRLNGFVLYGLDQCFSDLLQVTGEGF